TVPSSITSLQENALLSQDLSDGFSENRGSQPVAVDVEKTEPAFRNERSAYRFPPLSLLHEDDSRSSSDIEAEKREKAACLLRTLSNFGIKASISDYPSGPRLTRYELVPDEGVRIRSIENLVNEIAMNLRALSVRIEAPIPGKAAIGVEVPNDHSRTVRLRRLLDSDTFRNAPSKTTVCLGEDVVGEPVFANLDKMPHLLVAGATGMGKSVCINSMLVSLLYKARPDEVKLILIDPKKVEFKCYSDIPHLLVPVVTDAQKAAGALKWAVNEMERRYDIIEEAGVRDIKTYNKMLDAYPGRTYIPQIVIIIDELHDLMMQAPDTVEDSICRIAQKARAAGILLIIGTQRPSVNVITGVIKANIPSRIAFHVAAQVDSRTILDAVGAEKLLNDGDMLFLCPGMKMLTPKRVQGAFLDDEEVNRVADFLRSNGSTEYDEEVLSAIERETEKCFKDAKKPDSDMRMPEGDSEEDLFYKAVEVALENEKVSTSLLQRKMQLGFGKAARMIDRMQEMGIVSPPNGQKPR
ncbi:MAG: DNA translocase FtsK, partial [Clostridia bacterium]|nr:DNA translocase FtsK [Clostridia bacterium]